LTEAFLDVAGTTRARRPAASISFATLVPLVFGTGGGDHVGARLSQRDRGGRADPLAGTGDDRNPVGDTETIENHPCAPSPKIEPA
jgi:hypothetical protein